MSPPPPKAALGLRAVNRSRVPGIRIDRWFTWSPPPGPARRDAVPWVVSSWGAPFIIPA